MFFFSQRYGIIILLDKYVYCIELFLSWAMWPIGLLFSEFHQIFMHFVDFFLLQIPNLTPYLQSINYARPSRGILYRLRHLSSLHTSTLSLTQQHKLQTTPLNNVNSRPPLWTMWTPDHPTEQCELQTTHWTMWTPDHPTEQCELRTTHWTMWIPDNPSEQCELRTTSLNNVKSTLKNQFELHII